MHVLASSTLLLGCLMMACIVPGCIDCYRERDAFWTEQGIPPLDQLRGVEYQMGDLSGTLRNGNDGNISMWLSVDAQKRKVTHDEMVGFANALFASQGWPAPTFTDLEESEHCSASM